MEEKQTYEPVSVEVIELKMTSALVGSPGEGGGGGGLPPTPSEEDDDS